MKGRANRFGPLLAEMLRPAPPEPPPHMSKEAFCLMWYACPCGHRERIWNSRDGVTPFAMQCPSCASLDCVHVDWHLDAYSPTYQPAPGQRVWIDLTRERAEQIAAMRIEIGRQRGYPSDADTLKRVADGLFHDGLAPDLRVHGYDRRDR